MYFFYYYIARAKSKDVNNVRHQSFVFELLYTWLKPFTTAPPLWKLALPTKPGQHHISWALLRLSHFWLSHPLKWSSRCRRGESWPSLSSSLFCFQLFLPLSMWEWTEGSWATLLCYVTEGNYTLLPSLSTTRFAIWCIISDLAAWWQSCFTAAHAFPGNSKQHSPHHSHQLLTAP